MDESSNSSDTEGLSIKFPDEQQSNKTDEDKTYQSRIQNLGAITNEE